MTSLRQLYRNYFPTFIRRPVQKIVIKSLELIEFVTFCTPNILKPSVQLSTTGKQIYENFKKDGVVAVYKDEFAEVADYLVKTYLPKILELSKDDPIMAFDNETKNTLSSDKGTNGHDLVFRNLLTPLAVSGGLRVDASFRLSDEHIEKLVLDQDILGVFYNYLRRQPYFRNDGQVIESCFNGNYIDGNRFFHVDRIHQLSVMLLIADLEESDTHLEYAIGSNNRSILKEGTSPSIEFCEKRAKDHEIFFGCGKKGTAILFDSSGFHRVRLKKGTTRKVFFLNFTSGHHLYKLTHNRDEFESLEKHPKFIQKALRL
jgi:hypothetical protein